jgi:hypothetical protein
MRREQIHSFGIIIKLRELSSVSFDLILYRKRKRCCRTPNLF